MHPASHTAASPQQRIAEIDGRINVARWALHLRSPLIYTLSAKSWQAAWDRNPGLRAQEADLFRQRGIAQQERDAAEHKAWMTVQRIERASRRKALAAA